MTLYFNDVRQVAAPIGRQASSVWSISSKCGIGGKVCYVQIPCYISSKSKQRVYFAPYFHKVGERAFSVTGPTVWNSVAASGHASHLTH